MGLLPFAILEIAMRWLMLILTFVLIAAAPITVSTAQTSEDAACTPLVATALESIGSNCDSMDRNSACYGYNLIEAEFTRVQAEDFFSQPADRAQLVDLSFIQTSPLTVDSGDWGIAVLNLQANLPQFLPGQSVIFLMIGDVSLENTAPTSVPVFPVIIATTETVNARSAPSETANSYGELLPGSQLGLLGKNASEDWVRADIQNIIGWLPVSAFDPVQIEAALPQLTVVEDDAPLPMQAFTLRTSFDNSGFECAAAPPSLLLVQGPERVQVSFEVNGANVQIASTVLFYQTDEDTLRLATLDGEATVGDGQVIPQGFAANASLNDDGEVEEWDETEPIPQDELERLRGLELLNNEQNPLLNYPVDVPDDETRITPTVAPTIAATRRPVTAAPRASATPTIIPSPVPEPTGVPFVNFFADNSRIRITECTFVRWETGNIDSVFFEGEPTVGVSERQVCPRQTTTYGLLVRFRDGTEQRYTVTVEVDPSTPAPICGDAVCNTAAGENMQTCTSDCTAPVCGNYVCEPGEDGCNCGIDCGTYMCPG